MKSIQSTSPVVAMSVGGIIGIGVLAVALTSCQNPPAGGGDASGAAAQASAGPARGGAELWAQNCQHCHNSRSPASYSDKEWDVAMMHMRNQARLTADEYRAIRDFLQAGN